MNSTHPETILFITGAFVSETCWDAWQAYFRTNGYRTLAPCWPHKDAPAEVLRGRHPDPEIASLRLKGLTEYFAGIAASLPEKPILIGHSIGGLIVQLLLQRGLGAAGVAIHSVPPLGVMTFKFSFLRSGWGPLGLFTSPDKSFLMSFPQWQYAFTNGMDCDAQKEAYYQYLIPESKRLVRDSVTTAARIDFSLPHAPLLLISGSDDHFIPDSLNESNYKKYRHKDSVTDYAAFRGRNHFVLGQPTWKEEADHILHWIEKVVPTSSIKK